MIVLCNSCQTKYSVDERKIPPTGVKVKCHKCQNIIFIKPPESTLPSAPAVVKPEPLKPTVPEPPKPTVPEPPKPTMPEPPKPTMPEPPKPVIPHEAPKPTEPMPEKPAGLEMQGTEYQVEKPTQPSTVESAAGPAVSVPAEEGMSEEDKKWHQRAKRLAKALASDLVLYNQSKVEEGLRNGTLVQLLGAEIRRSWEYYCQQIPKKIVDNTDYFKEQLNKIVGKGKELFK